jgi:hypothetical protein
VNFKQGVKVAGLKPEIVLAAIVANEVYAVEGHSLTITSGTDGEHMPGSRHYTGQAIDIRTRILTDTETETVANEIRKRLTDEYDVVFEGNHIHIEFDPE